MDSLTDSKNEINIMLATDIHLGVHEKDGIRAEDSFVTFEEILKISKEKDVDFILLGGDLFHDNKPSPQCLHKCLTLLRKYCMGDKPIHIEFLSDPNTTFKNCAFPTVNYEDPNFNISVPVFSIHGNHDDPSGFGRMSTLDILSVTGFVNYFGKWTDLNSVKMHPLMLKKRSTKLAIYGLSHIKDERLYRLLKNNEVEFVIPANDPKSFFNLMVLHQNRVDRAGTNHIPESLIPSFIDLVFWGHEHECRVKPEWNQENKFFVTQPGSPVATSLCDGEAVQKHVAILKIENTKFNLESVPLKTVRPFVFDSVKLSDWNMRLLGTNHSEIIQKYVDRYIRSKLLEKAKDLRTDDPNQPKLPLIRLRIEFEEDSECFNAVRFGQTFTGTVANPSEMVILKRKMSSKRTARKGNRPQDMAEPSNSQEISVSMGDLIEQYFEGLPERSQMKVLNKTWMTEAMTKFIDKDDKEAIDDTVYNELNKVQNYVKTNVTDLENINEIVNKFNELRTGRKKEEIEEARQFLESDTRSNRDIKVPTHSISKKVEILSDDDDDDFGPSVPSTINETRGSSRGRGRARGRGSRGSRGGSTRGARGAAKNLNDSDFSEFSNSSRDISSLSTSSRKSARNTSSRTLKNYFNSKRSEDSDSDNTFGSSPKKTPKKKAKFSYIEED